MSHYFLGTEISRSMEATIYTHQEVYQSVVVVVCPTPTLMIAVSIVIAVIVLVPHWNIQSAIFPSGLAESTLQYTQLDRQVNMKLAAHLKRSQTRISSTIRGVGAQIVRKLVGL